MQFCVATLHLLETMQIAEKVLITAEKGPGTRKENREVVLQRQVRTL